MINVRIGQDFFKKDVTIDESTTTLSGLLTENGFTPTGVNFHLNGDTVTADMWDKTFAECGIYENCYLTAVTKADSN